MATSSNAELRLAKYVDAGIPSGGDFEVVEVPVPELTEPDSVKLQLVAISVDPYMRGRMGTPNPAKPSYVSGWVVGEPCNGGCIAKVLESTSEKYAVGDAVMAYVPWRQVQVAKAASISSKVDLSAAPPGAWVGALGMPGLTAILSIQEIGKPKEGEIALVSGAAGAAGGAAVQILKAKGCRVVGICGTDEKVEYVRSLGADAVINYKTSADLAADIATNGPYDIYFDNVGGPTLDAALANMNRFGRIIACGQISQYNLPPAERYGVKNIINVVGKSLHLEGFIVSQWAAKFPVAVGELLKLYGEGKLHPRETAVEGGLASVPSAFAGLFTGANIGKMVVMM